MSQFLTLPLVDTAFYVTGGTLPPDAPSYIERQADRDLCAALLEGDYCYVLNSRQMGKSSLCVRTVQRLRAEGARTAFIDLTKLGGAGVTREQWYAGLLSETGRELGLRREFLAYWKENQEQSLVLRYFGALRAVALEQSTAPLICFIDEVDTVRSLSFSADEFFAAIRECYNRRAYDPEYRRLSFCLLGVASPTELIADTQTTPFNIGRRIELRDFTYEEARPLAEGLENDPDRQPQNITSHKEQRAVSATAMKSFRRILYWTGGHPYLTQVLSKAVGSRAQDPQIPGESAAARVDRSCHDLFLSLRARDTDDNLAFVRNRLLTVNQDLAALLELYDKVLRGRRVLDDPGDPRVEQLTLTGLVRVEQGRLRPRNRIYARVFDRRWVRDTKPGADVRRQQRAFRRGVRLTIGIIGGATALLAGAFLLWRHNLDADFDLKIPEVKEWNTNQRNAFINFSAAATAVIGKQTPDQRPLDDTKVGSIAGNESPQQGEAIVRLNAMPLMTLRTALHYPYHEPEVRSYDTPLYYFAQLRNLARLVKLDGQVHAAHKDWGAAVGSCLDDVEFGTKIAKSTTVIGRAVGVACEAIGRSDIWRYLDHLDARQARLAARRLEAIMGSASPLADVLREERWADLAGMQELCHRPDWRAEVTKFYKVGNEIRQPSPLERDALQRLWYTGKRQTLLSHSEYDNAWIARVALPYRSGTAAPKPPNDPATILIGLDFYALWMRDLTCQTCSSLLCASLALRAYRQERGVFPQDLPALVSAGILDREPIDPFADGATLHYRRQGAGYLLYSVGPNGKDDAGNPVQLTDENRHPLAHRAMIALPLASTLKSGPERNFAGSITGTVSLPSGDFVVTETGVVTK